MTAPTKPPIPRPSPQKRRPRRPGRRKNILLIVIGIVLTLLTGVAIGISLIDKKILARIDEIRNARPIPVFSQPLTLRLRFDERGVLQDVSHNDKKRNEFF